MSNLTVVILCSLVYFVSRFADIYTSSNSIYYGSLESNPLSRDKYHQFSLWRSLVLSAIFYAICLTFALLIPYMWVLFLPFIFGSFFVAFGNYRLNKRNRAAQIELLTHLEEIQLAGADRPHIEEAFNGQLITSISGRAWYTLFGWIYEPGVAGDPEVRDRLITRIAALALETNWFPK